MATPSDILWKDCLTEHPGLHKSSWNRIKRVLNRAFAPATIKSYSRYLSDYQNFLSSKGLTRPYPSDETTVMWFIVNKKSEGKLFSTLQGYVSAVAFAHKVRGLRDPTSSFIFKKFMTGLKRDGRSHDQLQPVSSTMLKELINLVPCLKTDNYTKILLRSVMSLLYHACLRVSEITVSPNADHAIKQEDFNFHLRPPSREPDAISMTLKTFKHSRSTQTIECKKGKIPAMCPVKLLAKYFSVRPKSRYLLCDKSGQALSRSWVAHWLRKLVLSSSFKHQKINTHSFRIGRTTDLVLEGKASDTYIQHVGRWSSTAYKRYIRSIVVL